MRGKNNVNVENGRILMKTVAFNAKSGLILLKTMNLTMKTRYIIDNNEKVNA